MAYATVADYELYGSGQIPPDELPAALERASDQIDTLTYNRIAAGGTEALTPFQALRVKKAVCQQADFFYSYGDYIDSPLSGYSAGSVSVSFQGVSGAGGIQTSQSVTSLLASTGLTSRRLC
ncbi:hypothetical protein [Paenibacillus sp. NFR01]|uniref:hypothetical protein n=1 Tax=Paenibacillus sp. NFR01 TaxID=1566279 RepID=UPI0008B1B485|nr:hypothetical protein [Paenibacillus sp. NFR01]SEU32712.1 hypothetical protein SAMN03159358_0146 [Paenibacillus sp. NFR01]